MEKLASVLAAIVLGLAAITGLATAGMEAGRQSAQSYVLGMRG